MRSLLFFFLAASLFVFGCAGGSRIHVHDTSCRLAPRVSIELHADVAFTQLERTQIDRAAREWEYYSNGFARMRVVYDADMRDVERLSSNNLVLRVTSKAPFVHWADDDALAYVVHDGVNKSASQRMFVIVDRIRDAEMLYRVVLHEIGHVLWLPNEARGARAVMSENVNNYVCPQRADMESFCAFHRCRLEDVRWCE